MDRLTFHILGPVEAELDGVPIRLGRSLRALLGVLLLHPNQPVPAITLQRLFPNPATIRSHVQHLRDKLDPDRPRGAESEVLAHVEQGYLLRLRPEQLDTTRFERLVTQGQQALARGEPREAAAQLHAGLALWRGPLLADLADHGLLDDLDELDVAAVETARLEGLRLAAHVARIEAEIALGRNAEVLPGLERLLEEEPDDEHVRRLLALAQYRTGRTEQAAETCREGVLRLRELGLDDSALQALQTKILRRDPELDQVAERSGPPRPQQLPAGPAWFVGRVEELRVLRAHLDPTVVPPGQPTPARAAGRPRVAIAAIDGKPGIGKSALAVTLAYLLLPAYRDGILFAQLHGADPDRRVEPIAVLHAFLRALGVPADQLPAGSAEAATRFRSELAGRRVLVVLDDAADAAHVRPLLPAGRGCGAIVTSRVRLALAEALPSTLGLLPTSDAIHLLELLDGRGRIPADPTAATQVAKACGFLPLALQIAGSRLANRSTWSAADLAASLAREHHRLGMLQLGDLDVRASFALSYRGLPAEAARAFRLLSLADVSDLSVATAGALVIDDETEVAGVLEHLLDAQLLEQAEPRRYRFHDLLRLFARERADDEEQPEERLAALRRLLAWYRAAVAAADELIKPPALRSGDLAPVPGIAFAERRNALAWLEGERRNLVTVIRQAALHDDPTVTATAWQLGELLFRFFDLTKHWADWLAVCEAAVSAARRAADRAQEARALSRLGTVLREQGRVATAIETLTPALEVARQTGDPELQSTILNGLGIAYQDAGKLEEAIGCHQQRLALARAQGDRFSEAASRNNLGDIYREQGHYGAAIDCFDQSLAIFEQLGEHRAAGMVRYNLGEVAHAQGRHPDAVDYHQRGLDDARGASDRFTEAWNLLGLGHALAALDGREAALPSWRAAYEILAALEAPQARAVHRLLNGNEADGAVPSI